MVGPLPNEKWIIWPGSIDGTGGGSNLYSDWEPIAASFAAPGSVGASESNKKLNQMGI
jgi:hypothetical protein